MKEKKSRGGRRKGKAEMRKRRRAPDFHSKLHLFFLLSSTMCAHKPTPTQTHKSTHRYT